MAIALAPIGPATAADVQNITVRTGPQLEGTFKNEAEKDQNIRAAANFFYQQKMQLFVPGLTQVRVQDTNTKEITDLFIMPFTQATPVPGFQNIVISTQGTKGSAVVLGTIYAPSKEQKPVVKEEHRVADGKVQAGDRALEKWLLCTLGTCMTGAACFAAGPDPVAIGCLCLVCAGGAIACSKDLL